jgi:hypothetical protein
MYQKRQTILDDILSLAAGLIATGLLLMAAMFIFSRPQ